MSTKDRKEISEATSDAEQQAPKSISRRAVLRGAVTTMPVVLTLQSGAALARSSNMISASRYSSEDRRGRTLCLDTESVNPVGGSDHLFDLGEPPRAHVFAINDRDYRTAPDSNAPRITEEQICQSGQPGYFQSDYDFVSPDGSDDGDGSVYQRQWEQVQVRRGVLVSATALSSFAGSVRVTDL